MNKKPFHKNKTNNFEIIYGKHASVAVLNNNIRKIISIHVTEKTANSLSSVLKNKKFNLVDSTYFDKLNLQYSLHQGIVIKASPMPQFCINDLQLEKNLIILDQVTDPQNIGSILRTAAAFDFEAVILPKNNAPADYSTIAKVASGAFENTPIVKVTNIVSTIGLLQKKDYWIAGMDINGTDDFVKFTKNRKIALLMGSENKGLRQLTKANCDFLMKLPITNKVESLNVANAAAIAMYLLTEK